MNPNFKFQFLSGNVFFLSKHGFMPLFTPVPHEPTNVLELIKRRISANRLEEAQIKAETLRPFANLARLLRSVPGALPYLAGTAHRRQENQLAGGQTYVSACMYIYIYRNCHVYVDLYVCAHIYTHMFLCVHIHIYIYMVTPPSPSSTHLRLECEFTVFSSVL